MQEEILTNTSQTIHPFPYEMLACFKSVCVRVFFFVNLLELLFTFFSPEFEFGLTFDVS